jgi:hypothetical protein
MAYFESTVKIAIDNSTGTVTVDVSNNSLMRYYLDVDPLGVTLTTGVAITAGGGTPEEGATFTFYNSGGATLGVGGTFSVMGHLLTEFQAFTPGMIIARFDTLAWRIFLLPDFSALPAPASLVSSTNLATTPGLGGGTITLDPASSDTFQRFTGSGTLVGNVTITATGGVEGDYFNIDLNPTLTPGASTIILSFGLTTVTLNVADVNHRTFALAYFDGSNWDVVVLNRSVATTDILPNAVTNAKIRKSVGNSVIGNPLNTTADVVDVTFSKKEFGIGWTGSTLSTDTYIGMRVAEVFVTQAQARLLLTTPILGIAAPTATEFIQIHSAMVNISSTNASNSGIIDDLNIICGSAPSVVAAVYKTRYAFASQVDRKLLFVEKENVSETSFQIIENKGIYISSGADNATFVGDLAIYIFYSIFDTSF